LEIKKLKQQHNWVVLMYHGGEEFSTIPSPRKRKYFKKIATKTNVDAIIAHHSHTFQGLEIVNKKPIFYSLGNFVFDLENHEIYPHTNESAVVTLSFNDAGINYTFIPTECDSKNGRVQKGSMEFLNEIVSRSNFDDYKKKWKKECYRLVFQRPEHKTLNPEGQSLQSKSAIRMLFSLKFYTQIIRILGNWKLRNMYFNAIYFKISKGL
jgi:poly-gamma-glutamate synthesis protein (capsule biosynthesis protein)